jgi:hypothetical protein
MDNSFLYLIVLLIMHYFADWTHLSTSKMLEAKKVGKPLSPIFLHSLVHAILFSIVTLFFYNISAGITIFFIILISHFIIDFSKGILANKYPITSDIKSKIFWYILGLDQLLHQLFIIISAYICYYFF